MRWLFCRSQGCAAFWAAWLYFTLSMFSMNGICLVSFGLSYLKKKQRVRRIIGEAIYQQRWEKKTWKRPQPGRYLETFNLSCAGKRLSPPCCLMLQSVDHCSIWESPKSSIIAVVRKADQQMLFAAQEGVNNHSISLGCTVELSMVLKPGFRVSTSAPLVKRKWRAPLPTFTWFWQ